jgi:hypothetical protein
LTPFTPLRRPMRVLLEVAAALVLLAGMQLFGFPLRTAEFFAWTIANPLTAAFLGASYWASFVIEALAARERLWANARIAVPSVLVFTVLTMVVSLVHLGQFHLGARFALHTRVVAWGWLAIYALVPLLLLVVLVAQLRTPGTDPPRQTPPPVWLQIIIGAHAVGLLGLGLVLLFAPGVGARVWPWALTPLTGRAIGAWLIGLGVAAAHALVERDLRRLRPAAWGYIAIAILQAIALARFPHQMRWSSPSGVVYVAVLASIALVGVAAVLGGRGSSPDPSPA